MTESKVDEPMRVPQCELHPSVPSRPVIDRTSADRLRALIRR
jgi:hypothetical protein